VRPEDASAFAISAEDGSEVAVLVVQCREQDPFRQARLVERLKQQIQSEFGIACLIELVPLHTLPRTSSGQAVPERHSTRFPQAERPRSHRNSSARTRRPHAPHAGAEFGRLSHAGHRPDRCYGVSSGARHWRASTVLPTEPDLRILVRDRARASRLHHPECRSSTANLDDRQALAELVDGADAVIHLAGAIAGNSAEDFDRINVDGSARLADAVASHAPGAHALMVSSLAARQPDLSWYAESKARAEEVWKDRLTDSSTVLRPPAVYGPDDPALAEFWSMLARGWMIRLGPGDARFSLVHVDDVSEAIDRLLHRGPSSTSYTLSGPQPEGGWQWSDVRSVAETIRGRPIRTLAVPGPVLRSVGVAALAGSRMAGRSALLSPGKVRELRHVDWVCDNLALSAHLNWQPKRRLEDALCTLPGWTS
jgi:nucleoside-diphosphate-sugar epimerase